MMKKKYVYILGIVTGYILAVIIGLIVTNCSSDNGVILFPEEGECLSHKSFKIFQVLDDGVALAKELSFSDEAGELYHGMTVLFLTEGKYYFDDEIITPSIGGCIKQIGVYSYITNSDKEKTVPIVVVENE